MSSKRTNYVAQTIILTSVNKGDSFKNIIIILLFILWFPKPILFMTYGVYCWEKIDVGHSSDLKGFNPFTAKYGQRQNSVKKIQNLIL